MLPFKNLFANQEKGQKADTMEMYAQLRKNNGKNHALEIISRMLNEPGYTEYYTYLRNGISTKTIKILNVLDEETPEVTVEESIQSIYYEHVVCTLINGYSKWKKDNNTVFRQFDNADIYLMSMLSLEHPELVQVSEETGLNVIDTINNGLRDPNKFDIPELDNFYSIFDISREQMRTDPEKLIIMGVLCDNKRKVLRIEKTNTANSEDISDSIADDRYLSFAQYNASLIRSIHTIIDHQYHNDLMIINDIAEELYDIVVTYRLMRKAIEETIITEAEYTNKVYIVDMRNICLSKPLKWSPNTEDEKKILEEFSDNVRKIRKNSISDARINEILNNTFGNSIEYVSSIKDQLVTMIRKFDHELVGTISEEKANECITDSVKEYITHMLEFENIGTDDVRTCYKDMISLSYTDDKMIDEISDWDLILHVSLPVFDESREIHDSSDLQDILIGVLEEYTNDVKKEKDIPIKADWSEFKETGLLVIANQFLRLFGWELSYDIDDDEMCPYRVTSRSYDESSLNAAYKQTQQYMSENAQKLYEDADADK